MLPENSRSSRKNLSTVWIDYRKAFDSVPHSWILRVLELYKVSPTIMNFLKISMTKWKTNLYLSYSEGSIICENFDINSGIFQGDSLSPLLFSLALTPLSFELNDTGYGYKIGEEKISHGNKRGTINLEMCFKTAAIGLNTYLLSSDDRMLKLVLQHEKKMKLHSVTKESRKFKFQLNMVQEKNEQTTEATKAAKEIKKKAKQGYLDDMKKT